MKNIILAAALSLTLGATTANATGHPTDSSDEVVTDSLGGCVKTTYYDPKEEVTPPGCY
jgi:hypothetical protein